MMPVFSEAEVDQFRSDTPGTSLRVHLNNAGAALMPRSVIDTVIGHLEREAEIGGYEAHAENLDGVEGVYGSVAELIGAGRDEVTLADSATLAWQRLFYSLHFSPGDRILTTSTEFAANYVAYLQTAKRTGVQIEVIPDNATGALDPDALEGMLDERVKLISIAWVPSNGGLINPAAQVGRIARAHGIPYLLDACQAVGQLPINVADLKCDMLTATGRKFLRGPRGTGFAYIRRELLQEIEPAFIDLFGAPWAGGERYELRPDARRFETWEVNYATRLGLGAAVDYALAIGMDRIRERSRQLTELLRDHIAGIPGLNLQDKGTEHAAIISCTHNTMPAAAIKERLARHHINVSVSPPTTTPLDATARHLPDVLRLSPHYYNTEDEITSAARALRDSLG